MPDPISLRRLVAATLEKSLGYEAAILMGDTLATELERQMRRHGLALHVAKNCARIPPADAVGVPMSPEQQALVGKIK